MLEHIKRVRHMTSRPIHGMKLLIVLVGKNTIFLITVLSINNNVIFLQHLRICYGHNKQRGNFHRRRELCLSLQQLGMD